MDWVFLGSYLGILGLRYCRLALGLEPLRLGLLKLNLNELEILGLGISGVTADSLSSKVS